MLHCADSASPLRFLGEQLREVIKEAYLATRDAELKNYVELAKRSIRDVNEAGPADEKAKEEAKAILAKLEYGQDVFFFV